MKHSSKRLFIGLLGISLLLMAGLLLYIWKAAFSDNTPFLHDMLVAVFISLALVMTLAAVGLCSLVFTLLEGRRLPVLEPLAERTVHVLFPLAVTLAKLLQIAQEKVQRSFIEVNNQLVLAAKIKVNPKELLLLLPHCLQWSECSRRVTRHPENCRRCGRCPLTGILNLADSYGVNVSIATGGTLAREEVKKIRPKAIVAVACERDLTSGIIDSRPLPVLGVLNNRPQGPCHNTLVDIGRLEDGLRSLLAGFTLTASGSWNK